MPPPGYPQQYPRQEQPRREVAHPHWLTRKRQQRTAQMPTAISRDQQHLETVFGLAGVSQVFDQHDLRTAGQQRTGHGQTVKQ